jgi:transketolase C-terminal domain/subunit
MREGDDVTLVSFGKMVGYCLKVAEMLEKEGVSCEVRLNNVYAKSRLNIMYISELQGYDAGYQPSNFETN